MSIQKLENYNNKEAIREEVTILTNILQDVAREMMSEETFAAICQLEELSVKDDYSKLIQIIGQLTNEELADISRYFAVLPLLINISEDVDLAFEINHQNNVGQDYLGKISATIDMVSQHEDAAEILEKLNVVPVLTAHPT